MQVGYLGPRGTFSQYATELYLKNADIKMIQYENIAELILAASSGNIDEAVVPIENSIEGSVNITLDMLAWNVNLKIKKEIDIPIVHNLMVKHTNLKITRILSHPQAIGQCRNFLNKNFSGIPIQYTFSTAQAAELIAGGKENSIDCQWAAIAAQKAASEYGLTMLHSSIQDFDNNVTRFIVLSADDMNLADRGIDPTGKTDNKALKIKTSIIFSTENKPGSLYRILQILDLWDINMTKIESRPAKNRLGNYIFFVDLEGHREDADMKDALLMIARKTSFFKMLGSYDVLF